MAHQHVITIPAPGLAGLLPGRHLVTIYDDCTTVAYQPPGENRWGPPIVVAERTETWPDCPPKADDTYAVCRPELVEQLRRSRDAGCTHLVPCQAGRCPTVKAS